MRHRICRHQDSCHICSINHQNAARACTLCDKAVILHINDQPRPRRHYSVSMFHHSVRQLNRRQFGHCINNALCTVEESIHLSSARPLTLSKDPDFALHFLAFHSGCIIQLELLLQVYASFEPKSQPHRRATSQDMLQAIDDQRGGKNLIILDARNDVQFTGQVKWHSCSEIMNIMHSADACY